MERLRTADELADSFNGPDADEVCRVMGIGPDRRELYDKLVDQNDVELMSTMGRMFPGTIRMLDELAPHATLAILTNGSQRYCEASIEAFALSPYIALHSGFVSGVTKAQRIRQWQGETGATGAYAIGVTYGMGDREELAGADCLCDTPQEVAACCMRLIDAQ